MGKIKVIELFAGVGGFRLGLEGYNGFSASSGYESILSSKYEVVWSNQWEPSTKKIQHANIIYKKCWPKANHSEENIEDVIEGGANKIPSSNLLVGGFPCQDYSVANQLNMSKGLLGEKGVLWWSIYTILKKAKKRPEFLILENVPRLLKSPRDNPGKDFFTILCCLNELGYAVEWRVINASDYGAPQKRKRVYLFGVNKIALYHKELLKEKKSDIILDKGVFAEAFRHKRVGSVEKTGKTSLLKHINVNYKYASSPFLNSGFMANGEFLSFKTDPCLNPAERSCLRDVLQPINEVEKKHLINFKEKLKKNLVVNWVGGKKQVIKTIGEKWRFLKGAKNLWKINRVSGYKYRYNEGKMNLFDDLDKPSRTIVTREYTKAPNRMTHLISQEGFIRNLTPLEVERLNMFPDDHTMDEKLSDSKRVFLMGNALVVGIIERIGKALQDKVDCFGL